MVDWIVVAVLYIAGVAFFRLIGGVAAAGDAMRQWGEVSARRWRARRSSSI